MPNWTTNYVRMENIGNEDLYDSANFDFNKLVPEPKTKEECEQKYGAEYLDDGTKSLGHTETDKWFDWYNWHCDFWGTKWNACDTYVVSDDEVQFSTAWTEPSPIWSALSKRFPDRIIEITAEYEDGWITESKWENGIKIEYSEREIEYEYEEEE